jgi:uncharacterized protein (TIGR02145 family)
MKMTKNLCWAFIALAALLTGCKKDKQGVLATLTTTGVTNITAVSATLGGNISNTGGTTLTSRGICWATHTNPNLTDSLKYDNGGTGAYYVSVTSLNANTIYYVRAFVINGTGTAYGDQVTFTTAKGLPTVTTTAITGLSASAATAKSGGTVVNNGGATVTLSGICWSTSQNPTISNSKTTDSVGTGAFTSTLSLLISNSTYYVKAYATNSYGTAYGSQMTFNAGSTATVVDIDGNVYNTVTIGTQTWMTENLKVTHYQNGVAIVNAFTTTSYDWTGGTNGGGYTFTNGDTTTKAIYGLLYSSWATIDNRNIAPVGWHVPTDSDWNTLEIYEGLPAADTTGITTNGNPIHLGTESPSLQVGGSSGLNLQLSGSLQNAAYFGFGSNGYYWTSTPGGITFIQENWLREIYGSTSANYLSVFHNVSGGLNGADAYSVRCVKN